jgi:hypothetical protein
MPSTCNGANLSLSTTLSRVTTQARTVLMFSCAKNTLSFYGTYRVMRRVQKMANVIFTNGKDIFALSQGPDNVVNDSLGTL